MGGTTFNFPIIEGSLSNNVVRVEKSSFFVSAESVEAFSRRSPAFAVIFSLIAFHAVVDPAFISSACVLVEEDKALVEITLSPTVLVALKRMLSGRVTP